MKKYFVLIIVCYSFNVSATIRRVNNTGIITASPPNANLIYTNAQAAHDAAVAGDTLHIEPSGTTYGNLTVTKRLTIFGNGYFLGNQASNGNSNLQAITAPSMLTHCYFASGSENSVISGCTLDGITTGFHPSIGAQGVSNITIKRNNVAIINLNGGTNPVSNIVIIQNYIGYISDNYSGIYSNYLIANNLITNYVVLYSNNDNGIFQNNVIMGFTLELSNAIVRNNVINASSVMLTSCMVQNNIASNASSIIGTMNGNQVGVNLTSLFEDVNDTSTNWSSDSRFTLKNSSPGSSTGYGGSDVGAILNPSNVNNVYDMTYRLSGIPSIPTIYKFDAPALISGNTLNVIVSTRSNQ